MDYASVCRNVGRALPKSPNTQSAGLLRASPIRLRRRVSAANAHDGPAGDESRAQRVNLRAQRVNLHA
eukprot:7428247-Pyramimonas_sp.AAC.2